MKFKKPKFWDLKKPNLIPEVKTIALLGPGVTYITK